MFASAAEKQTAMSDLEELHAKIGQQALEIDIFVQPDRGACQVQKGPEPMREFVVARCQATKLFEAVESLDEVPRFVSSPVELSRCQSGDCCEEE